MEIINTFTDLDSVYTFVYLPTKEVIITPTNSQAITITALFYILVYCFGEMLLASYD